MYFFFPQIKCIFLFYYSLNNTCILTTTMQILVFMHNGEMPMNFLFSVTQNNYFRFPAPQGVYFL